MPIKNGVLCRLTQDPPYTQLPTSEKSFLNTLNTIHSETHL